MQSSVRFVLYIFRARWSSRRAAPQFRRRSKRITGYRVKPSAYKLRSAQILLMETRAVLLQACLFRRLGGLMGIPMISFHLSPFEINYFVCMLVFRLASALVSPPIKAF